MNLVNFFLNELTHNQTQTLYSIFNMLFWVVFTAFFFIYIIKTKKIFWKKVIPVLLIPYAANAVVMLLAGFIKSLTSSLVFFPTYYPVYFVPIMLSTAVVISFVVKKDLATVMDKFILSFFIARPCHCIACLFAGCCHGMDADWGIYSGSAGTTVIPLRLFELVLVLILWVVNHTLYLKKKFKYKGQCAALGTIEFGALIFVFDMLCTTPLKFFFSLSVVGITAFMTMIAGVLMLYIFSKKNYKEALLLHPKN